MTSCYNLILVSGQYELTLLGATEGCTCSSLYVWRGGIKILAKNSTTTHALAYG